jgi:hypothetical protein
MECVLTGYAIGSTKPGKCIPAIGRRVHLCEYNEEMKATDSVHSQLGMIGAVPEMTDRLHVVCIIFSVVVSDFLEHLVDASFVQRPLPFTLKACRYSELIN